MKRQNWSFLGLHGLLQQSMTMKFHKLEGNAEASDKMHTFNHGPKTVEQNSPLKGNQPIRKKKSSLTAEGGEISMWPREDDINFLERPTALDHNTRKKTPCRVPFEVKTHG
jgi:hypothetical protein